MANANNIVEVALTKNQNNQVVKLPILPKVAATNIEKCHLMLKNFRFNRGVFEDLSCYIVNPKYLAWTIKLRLPVDGEAIEGNGNSGFIPPTQLVYAGVLRNYMEKIVPLNFAVGDITIELRFVSGQELRLWCVDFVMEPVVRNDLPMPPVLPHIQCKQPSNQVDTFANKFLNRPWVPASLIYPPFTGGTNVNSPVQNTVSQKRKKQKLSMP